MSLNNTLRYRDPDGRSPLSSAGDVLKFAGGIAGGILGGEVIAAVTAAATPVLVVGVSVGVSAYLAYEYGKAHPPPPPDPEYGQGCGSRCVPTAPPAQEQEPEPVRAGPFRERPVPYRDPGRPWYLDWDPEEPSPPPGPGSGGPPPGPGLGGPAPGSELKFTEDRDPPGHWKSAPSAPIFSAPILRKKLPSFDIPCLSCSIFRQRMQNRIDKEAETLGR